MTKHALFLLLLISTNLFYSQNNTELNQGDKVPTFLGIDDTGKTWKSTSINSDFLVVYFYPAAMTGGCTKQACAYRDNKTQFDELNVTIIGISGDEFKNLQYFKEAHQLNFPLISDAEGKISKAFGIPTTKGGSISKELNGENIFLKRSITTPRWTFILDKNKTIIYKNSDVNASDDSEIVKAEIKKHLSNK